MSAASKIAELQASLVETGQDGPVAPIMSTWTSLGGTARDIGIVTSKGPIKCPTCGELAISFAACKDCGCPVCEYCVRAHSNERCCGCVPP
jgi:hypothetical protein